MEMAWVPQGIHAILLYLKLCNYFASIAWHAVIATIL